MNYIDQICESINTRRLIDVEDQQQLDNFWYELGTLKSETECMVIASHGGTTPAGVQVTRKRATPRQLHLYNTGPYLCNVQHDIRRFREIATRDPHKTVKTVLEDKDGSQQIRDYYFCQIAAFLRDCSKPGALLYYTGHGVVDEGNWVFKNGVITFDDIFNLYIEHFHGKLLYIVTDTCYSGQWTRRLAEKLEERNIGACGHLAKKAGFLIKVIAACEANEYATDGLFSEVAISTNDSGSMVFSRQAEIAYNQTTCNLDSTNIRCFAKPGAKCKFEQIPRSIAWDWQDLADSTKKENIASQVHLVCGWVSWKKVLTKDKVFTKDGVQHVICDGYGRKPPEEFDKIIVNCFY